jgi:hypothetical protein
VAEDFITAGMDFFGQEDKAWRDYEMFGMRVLQVPQSQVDMVYFDELGCSADEAQRMTPREIAKRYAAYKLSRNNFISHWTFDEDTHDEQEQEQKQIARAKRIIKERMSKQWTDDVNERYEQAVKDYELINKKENLLKKNPDNLSAEQIAEKVSKLTERPEYKAYKKFKQGFGNHLKSKFDKAIESYWESKTPQEACECLKRVIAMKPIIVEYIYADSEEAKEAAKAKWRDLNERKNLSN